MEVKIPHGRGDVKRGEKDKQWAKRLTEVSATATSGFDYDGPWLVCGAMDECEPGSLIIVGDSDGLGAALYCAIPDTGWLDEPWLHLVAADNSSKWAGKLKVISRKMLAMSGEERITDCKRERADELTKQLDRKGPGLRPREEWAQRIAALRAGNDPHVALRARRTELLAELASIAAKLPSDDPTDSLAAAGY